MNISNIFNTRLIANLAGATLEKSLPLVIAIFLTNYLTQESFGYWTQYFVILTVFASTITSPLQLFFSRDFASKNTKKFVIFNLPILSIFTVFTAFIIGIYFKTLLVQSNIVEMLLVFWLFVFYGFNNVYLRFNKRDVVYAKLSFLKIFLFICCIIFIDLCDIDLNFRTLLLSFLIAHVPIVFAIKKSFIIDWNIKKSNLGEFLRLSIYGLCTALLSGIDRIVVVTLGYTYEDLGFYAYALAFASLPSFLVEAIKQYMAPKLYNDLSTYKDYSIQTLHTLYKLVIGLILLQFSLPLIAFEFLSFMNMVNMQFIRSEKFFHILTILNLGFSFHIIYHFVNPYMFFFDRSSYLLFVQCFSVAIFTMCLHCFGDLSDELISFFRAVMFLMVLVLTCLPLFIKKISYKYVCRKL